METIQTTDATAINIVNVTMVVIVIIVWMATGDVIMIAAAIMTTIMWQEIVAVEKKETKEAVRECVKGRVRKSVRI